MEDEDSAKKNENNSSADSQCPNVEIFHKDHMQNSNIDDTFGWVEKQLERPKWKIMKEDKSSIREKIDKPKNTANIKIEQDDETSEKSFYSSTDTMHQTVPTEPKCTEQGEHTENVNGSFK